MTGSDGTDGERVPGAEEDRGADATDEDAHANGTDPTVVHTLAVTTEDVLAALEASDRGRRDAVLRLTPPFSGRMRARLHVAGTEGEYEGDTEPVHVEPRAFVDPALPQFPGRGRERWRSRARESLEERVSLDVPGGPVTVRVRYLG